MKSEKGCRNKARVSEIFSGIQGEGIYLGRRQILVRFNECNLTPRCAFCDTPISDEPMILSAGELMEEVHRLNGAGRIHHSISFTGGEPLCQADFLAKFLPGLKGYTVYLETNGTLPDELRKIIEFVDIIAMDMKLPSSTQQGPFWDRHKEFLSIADEKDVFVKVVVTGQTTRTDAAEAIKIVEGVNGNIPLVLQPVTPCRSVKKAEPERTFEFQKMAAGRLFDVRVIPQAHKIVGLR